MTNLAARIAHNRACYLEFKAAAAAGDPHAKTNMECYAARLKRLGGTIPGQSPPTPSAPTPAAVSTPTPQPTPKPAPAPKLSREEAIAKILAGSPVPPPAGLLAALEIDDTITPEAVALAIADATNLAADRERVAQQIVGA